jgi:hypothetical protein
VIVLSSAPVLPTLPSVSQQPPSSSTPSPTAPSEIAR